MEVHIDKKLDRSFSKTNGASGRSPNSMAEKLIREVRAQMRGEYEAAVAHAFDTLETALRDARLSCLRPHRMASEAKNIASKSARRRKTPAQAARDLDIVYAVLTTDWQETKDIFHRAKIRGFRTGDANCQKKLYDLLSQGFVELDKTGTYMNSVDDKEIDDLASPLAPSTPVLRVLVSDSRAVDRPSKTPAEIGLRKWLKSAVRSR